MAMKQRKPRSFEEICKDNNLTSEDLSSLRDEVDRILPGVLKDAGVAQALTWDHVLTLEALGKKSIQNLKEAIEKSKERPLARVVFALGILHVGSEMAELLASHFGSMDRLSRATEEELMEIPGVGPKIAQSVAAYFRDQGNLNTIEKLRSASVRLEEEAPRMERELPLAGMQFMVTGRLESLSRSQAEARIRELGGSVGSSVSRKTSYLVAGEEPGSKLEQAKRLGTPLLSEEEFLRMVGKG